jgi:hypothetical protein
MGCSASVRGFCELNELEVDEVTGKCICPAAPNGEVDLAKLERLLEFESCVILDPEPSAYSCNCDCAIPERPQITKDLSVCLPPDLNANLMGGRLPLDFEIEELCSETVFPRLETLLGVDLPEGTACDCISDDPGTGPELDFALECNVPCEEPSGVCLVSSSDPPVPTPEPLDVAVFGQASRCAVAGSAEVTVGDETVTTGAGGLLHFFGEQCPEGGCSVGMSYQLDLQKIEFEVRFASNPVFEDLTAVGATLPEAAVVDSLGFGSVPPESSLTTVSGRRGGTRRSIFGTNDDFVDFQVDWAGRTCRLDGVLVGSVVDDSEQDLEVELTLLGVLENQPPRAVAGPDQVVECTSSDGASLTLDGSASSDADSNLTLASWRVGSPEVDAFSLDQVAETSQALGTTRDYILRVTDTYMQAHSDVVSASIVDTTPPELDCGAPPTITPRDAPITFGAGAKDACDEGSTALVSNVRCFETKQNGRLVDKEESCVVAVDDSTLTIVDSGGVGNRIAWDVGSVDFSGNGSQLGCEVLVINPSRRP